MTKTTYLITENQQDADLLAKVLPIDFTKNVKLVVGEGKYSAQSLARSILAVKGAPVALVVDTNTLNEMDIQEYKDFLQEALHQASANPEMFRVFMAVPEVEALLLLDPYIIENLFNTKYVLGELGLMQMQPSALINELAKKYATSQERSKIFEKLDARSIALIRKHPLIHQITEFLSSMNVPQKQPVLH